jgi:hypothetical protein
MEIVMYHISPFFQHVVFIYNICRLKSTVQKLCFLCGSIATNDELVLLTIEGEWLEAIVLMT